MRDVFRHNISYACTRLRLRARTQARNNNRTTIRICVVEEFLLRDEAYHYGKFMLNVRGSGRSGKKYL